VLTSVAPASAAVVDSAVTASQVTSGRLNAPVVVKATWTGTFGANETVTLAAKLLTAAPASSGINGGDFFWQDYKTANRWANPKMVNATTGVDAAGDTAGSTTGGFAVTNSTSATSNSITWTAGSTGTTATHTMTAYGVFTPDKVGTYNFSIWADTDGDGNIDGAELASTVSVSVVDTAIKSVTVTSVGGNAPTNSTNQTNVTADPVALVKIRLVGSDDRPAIPATTEYIVASVTKSAYIKSINTTSGSGVDYYTAAGATSANTTGEDISGTSVQAVNLNYWQFGIDGNAYITVGDATAETTVVTATVGGTSITGTVNQSFVDALDTADANAIMAPSTVAGVIPGTADTADQNFTVKAGSAVTNTYYVASTTSSDELQIDITDTLGGISGLKGAVYSIVAATGTTAGTTAAANGVTFATATNYITTFSITHSNTEVVSGTAYSMLLDGEAAQTVSTALSSATSGATGSIVTPAGGTLRTTAGSTISYTIKCVDNFGTAKSNVAITPTFSATSRNYALVTLSTAVTNASGLATVSYTDVSTSATNLTDSIDFAGCTTNLDGTVNFAAAGLSVDAVEWTAGEGFEDDYDGQSTEAITATDSTHTGVAITFTVTDAAGNGVAGVPVSFTSSGITNAGIKQTSTVDYKLQYTNADGEVTTYPFAWGLGRQTITATAGGKTATAHVDWVSAAESAARVISATVSGATVTFKVVDRYGNAVEGVDIDVTTDKGGFGNGASTLSVATTKAGTVSVFLTGADSGATVTGSLNKTNYPQSIAAAGYITTTAVTAAVAGTTTGIGAALTPAGVNSVSVTTEASSNDGVNSALDAANEATDAANAATDAANAAAEAADAATAAAQDAQAAVAALATSVASLIAGIKAQITTLTNLVIKIQKKVRA
jgi:hypothetical protein